MLLGNDRAVSGEGLALDHLVASCSLYKNITASNISCSFFCFVFVTSHFFTNNKHFSSLQSSQVKHLMYERKDHQTFSSGFEIWEYIHLVGQSASKRTTVLHCKFLGYFDCSCSASTNAVTLTNDSVVEELI